MLSGLFASGAASAASQRFHVAADASPVAGATALKSTSGQLARTDRSLLKLDGTKITPVLVKLDYDALASYGGGVPGFRATSPAVTGRAFNPSTKASKSYLGYVRGIQSRFTSALHSAVPRAEVGASYQSVYGGIAVRLPANQISKLVSLPGVAAVQADELHQANADLVTDDDASFIGGNTAYAALGSSETAGKGVIIADIDTGVWPEHPSFANRSDLAPPPPTADGHARACNFGPNPSTGVVFQCNDKLIEGQVFLNTYNSLNDDELYKTSARDSNGHGTHTTSTAGGNPIAHPQLFGIDRGPIQGIAPGAYLMSYKALGPGGGYDSDLVAAIQQAVKDGADVINYSIGPTTPQSPYSSPDDLAFLDAFDAGVFVSASSGNSGANTASHLGPWETTVGATTLQRAFTSTASLTAGDGATLSIKGSSIMPGISTATPVVEASDAPYSDQFCGTPAPAGTFTGKIVICVRGGTNADGAIGRAQKGFDVAAGGAAGMFLINPTVQDTETDNHYLPAVHFDAPQGNQLQAFMAGHSGVTATFTTGQKDVGQGDVMAAFSSTGAPTNDFLKPDIAAPGVQILAGNTPTPTDVASGPSGQLYQAIAGTSMAAPHITGSAALVLALHPGMSPAEVKSALMMTATTKVVKADGSTPASPFDDGAGRVNLAGVVNPGLVLDVTPTQMDTVLSDPIHRIDLNEPSVYDPRLPGRVTTTRTFTNITNKAVSYAVSATSTLRGGVSVSPRSIHLPPHGKASVQITLDGTDGTVGTPYTGQVMLTQTKGGTTSLHLPVGFVPSDASTAPSVTVTSSCDPATIAGKRQTTCTAHVQNNAFDDATVTARTSVTGELRFVSTPNGRQVGQGVNFGPMTLKAATPPKPSVAPGESPAGYLDLADFGIGLNPIGDEQMLNLTLSSPFVYDGVSYTKLGISSDGYLVVGGGTGDDIQPTPPDIPNPARPNNVLAPLWTDLDGGAGAIPGEGVRVGALTDGTNTWEVVQYDVHVFGTSTPETFQVWIGLNGTQDISYTYDPAHPITDPGVPFQVGAEDVSGLFGNAVPGLPSADLVVSSTPGAPGGSADLTSVWRGQSPGTATVETDVNSDLTRETAVSRTHVTVTR